MPQGWEWLLLIAVLLLLFGAKKLPEMARSIGQSARVFKGEMKGMREDEARSKEGPQPPPALPPAQPDPRPASTPNNTEHAP